jgi:hypothetical protein
MVVLINVDVSRDNKARLTIVTRPSAPGMFTFQVVGEFDSHGLLDVNHEQLADLARQASALLESDLTAKQIEKEEIIALEQDPDHAAPVEGQAPARQSFQR